MSGDGIDISFVIPVRNDADRLQRCLRSIASNDATNDRVEVLVIDNGSTDASAMVAERAGATVIAAPRLSVARLRNVGAEAARGRMLAFVDADHVLGPRWIRVALEIVDADAAVGAAGSLCQAPADGTWVQRSYDRLRGRRPGRAEVEWLGAGNMVVRKSAFERIGGFDTHLETCEDVDLCKRLRAEGYRLIADERMINVHLGDPATLADLFRGELWRGRSNLAVSFRRPLTLQELPSAVLPIVQLTGLMIAPVAFALSSMPVAAGALALTPLAIVPIMRTLRMSRVSHGTRQLVDNIRVAFVYDLARALALVAFANHGVRRP